MGLFNNYYKEGKGVSKEQKTPRLILFFQIFFRKFWKLISINMLYVLFCIPIVTIGPATAGFTKIMRNFAREEHAFLWGDFIETFKKNFKQAFLFSVIDLLVYGFLILDFFALQAVTNRLMMIFSMAAILLTLTVWTFMHYYIYSMMITFDLTLRQLLKNSFIFCWAGFIRNLCLTVILVTVTVLAVQYLNVLFLLFLVATLYFSFCGLLINFMVNPLIKKHMIDGFDPQTGERLEKEKYEGFEDYEKDELDEE
jgi:uncharacterized membrane protein YesL